ncbi:MAG: DUF4350 domain-containing protein [Candidatus Dormibacteraeota bacterium]|nr:DUF4350 domain-containing protein [Candidatus Dormibacteraeota bacterium]
MRGRGWAALGGLALLVAVLVLLRGPSGSGDSPEHRSNSDGPGGTSALRLYAQALGHPAGTVEGDFTLPSSPGLLLIFTPTSGFSVAEAQQVNSWLTAGGIVAYADEQAEPQLDTQFGIHRGTRPSPLGGSATANAPAPIFGGVQHVEGGTPADWLKPSPAQVTVLVNAANQAIAIRQTVGQGQLLVLTDPLILCNRYLGKPDNGRFAADLMALAPAGSQVLFDEFHHGAAAAGSPQTAWMTTPWGAALVWAVIVLFMGLALRGRAFGPALSLYSTRDRSSAEYAAAIGSLLHRTGARAVTLETLMAATRRAIAERIGLGAGAAGADFERAVATQAPALGRDLARIEGDLPRATETEAAVLDTARRLHDLAYPLASNPSGKEPG